MGGMSSSLLASKFADHIRSLGYTASFTGIMSEDDIKAVKSSDADYAIAYMHAQGITNENRKKHGQMFDVVLIAPQTAFLIPKLKAEATAGGYNAELINPIPSIDYGRANVDNLFELIQKIIAEQT